MNKRDYVNKSDKYLFAVYKDGKIVDNRFYLTLNDAINSQKKKILIDKSINLDNFVIEMYERKNESIQKKENTYFDFINTYRLFNRLNKKMQLSGYINPNLLSTLPYNKIIELSDIIYDFLQKNLSYQVGKRVKIFDLSAYLKYLNRD